MSKISIRTQNYSFEAKLYNTLTAMAIVNSLPLQGNATLWGGEIYFETEISVPLEENARVILDPGELGFWTIGSVFCIFFGPTPASSDKRPKAYSPVNVFGKVDGDLSDLENVKQGEAIRIELI